MYVIGAWGRESCFENRTILHPEFGAGLFAWDQFTPSQTSQRTNWSEPSDPYLTFSPEVRAGFGLDVEQAKDGCRFVGGSRAMFAGQALPGGSE